MVVAFVGHLHAFLILFKDYEIPRAAQGCMIIYLSGLITPICGVWDNL